MEQPLVSICCITFNHARYLHQCLQGFLSQKTIFKYEILIHDDASTDNTDEIIREYERQYPDIIKPIYQIENQYSKGCAGRINALYNFPRAKGKYIAMCEGDDYWIDPLKLQKQVEFLESNPECSLCFTGCEIYKSNGERKTISYSISNLIDANEYLEKSYFMATASLMYRFELVNMPSEEWMLRSFAGDFILRYKALIIGKIGYVDLISVVYNKGVEGSWSNRNLSRKTILKEFKDNLSGLYYLGRNVDILKSNTDAKIQFLKKEAFLKFQISKPLLSILLNYIISWKYFSIRRLLIAMKNQLKK